MIGRAVAALTLLQLLVLCGATTQAASQQQLRVPRLLHRSFMSGAAALQAATRDPASGFKAHWLASCTAHNPGWAEVVWDEAAVLGLIASDYPWVLQAYLSYPKLVQRSDVARYMVLHKHGGVYLDADVECYGGIEASLLGLDLVLNCEYPGDWGQLHNAAMASAPGHPFWLAVLQEALQRAPAAPTPAATAAAAAAVAEAAAAAAPGGGSSRVAGSSTSWVQRRVQRLWEATPFANRINAVLRSTGPMLLTDVYQAYIGGALACGHAAHVDGRVNTAYPLGSWFTPCLFHDKACQMAWTTQHFNLAAAQLGGGAPVQLSTPEYQRELQQQERQQQQRRQQHRQQQMALQPPVAGSSSNASSNADQQQQHFAADFPPVIGIHHYSGSWTGWTSGQAFEQELSRRTSQHVLDFFSDSPAFIQHACASAQASAGDVDVECLRRTKVLPQACSVLSVAAPAAGVAAPPAVAPAASAGGCCNSSTGGGIGKPFSCSSCDSINTTFASGLEAVTQQQVQQQQQQDALSAMPALQRMGCEEQLLTLNRLQLPAEHAVLRLSCSGCAVPLLRRLFAMAAADSRAALQSVAVLIVDLDVPQQQQQEREPVADRANNGSSSSNSSSSTVLIPGLDELYNLLHQQLGFTGLLRQQLSPRTLRLGWARALQHSSPQPLQPAAVAPAAPVDAQRETVMPPAEVTAGAPKAGTAQQDSGAVQQLVCQYLFGRSGCAPLPCGPRAPYASVRVGLPACLTDARSAAASVVGSAVGCMLALAAAHVVSRRVQAWHRQRVKAASCR